MNLKKMNLAEWLAFSRLLTFPIVLLFIFLNKRDTAAWLYLIFFTTDFLDGLAALMFNQESKRRANLDSWGDIIFLITGMVGFAWFETGFFLENLPWILIPLFLYIFELGFAMKKFKRKSSFHTYFAKVTAFFQVIFLVHMFFFSPNLLLFGIAVCCSILDPFEDIYITYKLKTWKANVRGIWCV